MKSKRNLKNNSKKHIKMSKKNNYNNNKYNQNGGVDNYLPPPLYVLKGREKIHQGVPQVNLQEKFSANKQDIIRLQIEIAQLTKEQRETVSALVAQLLGKNKYY